MPVLEEILSLDASQQQVFDLVGHFENTCKWDPGVKASSKRGDEPTAVGTTYDLTTVFKGSESQMVYSVTEWDPPRRVVISGESDMVTTVDTIEVFPTDDAGKTRMVYNADIRLKVCVCVCVCRALCAGG
jgi:carbon monoxide dehydrogenase subunit G